MPNVSKGWRQGVTPLLWRHVMLSRRLLDFLAMLVEACEKLDIITYRTTITRLHIT